MRLLVGLGNPGPGHAGHRHNIGFMAADEIVRRHGFSGFRPRFQGVVAEGTIGSERILALKPGTYMNRSGPAVQEAAQFYKIEPPDIIVVYDEIDLAPGRIRVKQGGGSGGHNGIRSVDAHIGPEFWRIRLGVGHPGHPDLVAPYVLRPFDLEERPMFRKLIEAVAEAFPLMVAGDPNGFMSKVNLLAPAPKPPKPTEEETPQD